MWIVVVVLSSFIAILMMVLSNRKTKLTHYIHKLNEQDEHIEQLEDKIYNLQMMMETNALLSSTNEKHEDKIKQLKNKEISEFSLIDYVKKQEFSRKIEHAFIMDRKEARKVEKTFKEILHFENEKQGQVFEAYITGWLQMVGLNAKQTPKQYDGGKDVIVKLSDFDIWIQAKVRYLKTGEMLQTKIIREFHSVIAKNNAESEKPVKGVVMTTHFVKYEARRYAKEVGIEIIDRKRLFEFVSSVSDHLLGGYTWEKDLEKKENFSLGKCECGGVTYYKKVKNKNDNKTYEIQNACVNYMASRKKKFESATTNCKRIEEEFKVRA